MNVLGKSLLATVATATLVLGATAPASAQAWNGQAYDHGAQVGGQHDNVGPDNARRDYDRHDGDRRDNDRMRANPRFAIEQCSRAAVDQAHGNARVTRIASVDRTGDGFRVRGELSVARQGNRWGNWGHDRNQGSFTCRVDHGRIVDLDLHGLRG